MDLCWLPCENSAWEIPGPTAGIPIVKVVGAECISKKSVICEPSQWVKSDTANYTHR